MKTLAKAVVGALAIASAAVAAATPAAAHTGSSFGFYFGTGPRTVYDPCHRPYYARPAYCRYPVFYGRVFFGTRWHDGPFHYRDIHGHRYYWFRDGWRRGHIYGPPGHRYRHDRGRHRGWYR